MQPKATKVLQIALSEKNLYDGPADGSLNATLGICVGNLIADRKAELSRPPGDWSDKRKRVAAFQLMCTDTGIDVGIIDGLWGQLAEYGLYALGFFQDTGNLPIQFRDIVALDANPNNWPTDKSKHGSQADLFDIFDFNPINGGEPQTVIVRCPWTLRLQWDLTAKTNNIGAHPKVAQSLGNVLTNIHDHYGTDEIKRLRLDIYGGCKNVRKKRGGSTLSIHSFAAALDWDPDKNKLDWGWRKALMARPEYLDFWRFWEEEGWLSLGRTNNFDWMHVQAVRT